MKKRMFLVLTLVLTIGVLAGCTTKARLPEAFNMTRDEAQKLAEEYANNYIATAEKKGYLNRDAEDYTTKREEMYNNLIKSGMESYDYIVALTDSENYNLEKLEGLGEHLPNFTLKEANIERDRF